MTRTRATIVTALSGFALATSLGAGPATRPARAPETDRQYRETDRHYPLNLRSARDVAPLARPAQPAPFPNGSRVIVPPRLDDMPGASVDLTPRAQWIPQQFNGGTFYLIPCERTETATAAAPAPASPSQSVRVDWGKLLTAPSTQPSAAAAPAR